MRLVHALFCATLIASAPAAAEEDACKGHVWPLVRETAWFGDPGLRIVTSGEAAPTAGAVVVRLNATSSVAFALPPVRAPRAPDSFGAILKLQPTRAGMYQVTLSDEAWIDVVQDGARLKSAAFSGQRGCKTLRKSVRFDLGARPR